MVYNQYTRLINHWQKVMPEKILTVDYEELVNDQIGRKLEDWVLDRCLQQVIDREYAYYNEELDMYHYIP